MFKASLLTVAVAGAARMAGERDYSEYQYANYVTEFSKVYTTVEHSQRRGVFDANMAFIKKQNAIEDKSWYAGVNKFTDMTESEFKAQGHGHKAQAAGSKSYADVLQRSPITRPLPKKVDWRKKSGVVTPVKNQESCGSCWAFSATESLESAYAIHSGNDAPILSPQQIVSCAPDPDECGGTGGCQGSTQPLAFNYTKTVGITTEAKYPYKGKTGKCKPELIEPVVKNTGYVALTKNNYTELFKAVATVGPIAISVAAGGRGWQSYAGGVYAGTGAIDYVMDHAVQAVGYGSDNGKDYWWVRNSWGGAWGEKGYMRIERFGEGKEPCGMDNDPADGDACRGDNTPTRNCGISAMLSSSSYPTFD